MSSNYVEVCVSGIKCRVEDGEAENIFQIGELIRYALQGVGFHADTVHEILPDDDRNDRPVIDIDIGDLTGSWGHNSFGGIQATFPSQAEGSVLVRRLKDGGELRIHFPKHSISDPAQKWVSDCGILQPQGSETNVETTTTSGQRMQDGGTRSLNDATPDEWTESARVVMAMKREVL